ncbi:MAG TPA: LysM domain-containing protein [Actinomycetota bacterium]|nr:LysM domain-containing protein [Actinomycetota bacterium]
MAETFDPYEDEGTYDYYDEEATPRRRPRLLWGRIAALAGALVIAFMVGRASSGGDDSAELDRVRRELTAAQAEIDELETRLAEEETEPEVVTPAPSETAPESTEAQTYVVREGDTLRAIAMRFYGDPDLADLIAEENGITDPTELAVGQELIIPPAPE